jgi:hypothetical protein
LEHRELLDAALHFAFGPAGLPVDPVSRLVTEQTNYNVARGYGWQSGTVQTVARDAGVGLALTSYATFATDIPDGPYQVTLTLGDPGPFGHDLMGAYLEGDFAGMVSSDPGETLTITQAVNVTHGQLNVELDSLGGANPTVALQRLDALPAGASPGAGVRLPARFDFGTPLSAVDTGATRVTPTSIYNPAAGYGFQSGIIRGLVQAGTHFDYSPAATFAADVANGTYQVTLTLADPGPADRDLVVARFQGAPAGPATPGAGRTMTMTSTVNVTNRQLDVGMDLLGGTFPYVAIEGLQIAPTNSSSPPTATFSNSGPVNQGGTATVLFTNQAGGSGSYTYSYDFNNAGTFQVVNSPSASATVPASYLAAPGDHVVHGRITDSAGLFSDYTTTITVHSNTSSPPTATFDNSGPVNQGGTANVFFTHQAGGSGGYTYSYDFNNGGTFQIVNSPSASATVPASYLAAPGDHVVHGRITDSAGLFSDYTTTITVHSSLSVQPGGPYSGVVGTPIAFRATATGPAGGFTFSWSFGDGTFADGQAVNHAYAAPGNYVVAVTVTDADGGNAQATTSATVTPTDQGGDVIVTPAGRIPNFGAHPTIVSAHSGPWSDPLTWSLGRVPGAGDVVSIDTNTTVTYDTVSDANINTVVIQAGGHLAFRTDVNTRLTVTNLLVLQGGELQIGTAAAPVAANVTAEVIFPDIPLDTARDPEQFGHGLIGLGKVTMNGAAKNQTFVRLGAEPRAGATTLTLSQPVSGWRVGDQLVLPDTRQLTWETQPDNPDGDHNYQWEVVTLAGISADGQTLTLSQPLRFDHLGARDGDGALTFLPHVANLSRNVTVRSANPSGNRGYALFTGRADVDIAYTRFLGLGRTRLDPLDNTIVDDAGQVTHVGTNENDRSAIMFLHLYGPTTAPPDGYQYTFVGNTVMCPLDPMPFRWGIGVNDSHYGLIQDNVLYNWAGAGIVFGESGNESFNVIAHNFVERITGDGSAVDTRGRADVGHEGSALWSASFNNSVRDNVVSDAHFGYIYWATGLGPVPLPVAPGADTSQQGQYQMVDMNDTPLLEFDRNETYGGTTSEGLVLYGLSNDKVIQFPDARESVVRDFHVWHVYDFGYSNYETAKLTFDGLVARNDVSLLASLQGGGVALYGADYVQYDFKVINSDIQGFGTGFVPSSTGQQTIENTYMRNYFDVEVDPMWGSGTPVPSAPRSTVLRNDRFAALNLGGATYSQPPAFIFMNGQQVDVTDLIQQDTVSVYQFNGAAGDNFRVYYNEQAANAILPQTVYYPDGVTVYMQGSPEAGLTNAQNWARYHIAFAGSIAPSTATTRAQIYGLVDPI